MASQDWLEKDFYQVLGVSKDASVSDIKKTYRSLARQFHPDSNPGDGAAEARFKEISEAYSVLSDEQQRAEYDQIRAMQAGRPRFTAGGGPGGFDDVFGGMFGGAPSGAQSADFGDLFSGLFGGALSTTRFVPCRRAVHGSPRVVDQAASMTFSAECSAAHLVVLRALILATCSLGCSAVGKPDSRGIASPPRAAM